MADLAGPRRAPISETTLARDISGPLWGLVFLAALGASRDLSPDTFYENYTEFVLSSRPSIDGIIAAARRVGRFSTLLQEIFEEGLSNWGAENVTDADGISAWLCLYSSLLEEPPIDLANASLVQRLVAFGLQNELVDLLAALVRAAWARETDPSAASVHILEVMRRTLQLVPGADADDRQVAAVYRLWRVSNLSDLLRPDRGVQPYVRQYLRRLSQAIEERLPDVNRMI